jgi:hypothetical protein
MKVTKRKFFHALANKTQLICLLLAGQIAIASSEIIDLSTAGLPEPESIVDFSEIALGDTSRVSTEFSDFGVTFLPNLYYRTGDHPDCASVSGPNLRTGEPEVNPFSIVFNNPLTSAAVVAIAQPPTPATITAKLNGTEVESFNTTISIDNPNQYFGFTDIIFDEIQIEYTAATRLRIDNVQFGESIALEPLAITTINIDEENESKSVTLTWNSLPRRNYAVFVSTDMEEWVELDDNVQSEGDETTFTEETIPSEERFRFYKVEDITD